MTPENLIGTKKAAELAGLTVQTIQAHIKRGNLKAVKIGRDWLIDPADLESLKGRKAGRPKGTGTKGTPWHK